MTDRELLELAAKAAGIKNPEVQDMRGWGEVRYGFSEAVYDDASEAYWNPLTDDGDALRLAVKLNLNLFSLRGTAYAMETEGDSIDEQKVDHCGDPYAATRRAIVRAAAEIGKAAQL